MSVTCPTVLTPSCCQPPKPKSDVIFGTLFQVVGAMAYIDKKKKKGARKWLKHFGVQERKMEFG